MPNTKPCSARSAHLEITYLEATYLEASLSWSGTVSRVQSRFFFPFMHDIQDCTSLNQPGIIRNFSQKKLPCSKWMLTLHICSFFPLTSEISSSQSLHLRIILYFKPTEYVGKFTSIRNSSCFCCLIHERYFCQNMQFCLDIWTVWAWHYYFWYIKSQSLQFAHFRQICTQIRQT